MPSFKSKIHNKQCIIGVMVNSVESKDPVLEYSYPALIDTGATGSCISSKVVQDLSLTPKGKKKITSVTEIKSVTEYDINLYIPISKIVPVVEESAEDKTLMSLHPYKSLRVTELHHGASFDVLLGMDILLQCNFILAHGEFIISY